MKPQIANLVFDAELELLTGTIGDAQPFHVTAHSGGSRGHSQVNANSAKVYRHFEQTSFTSRFANTPTIGKGTSASPYKQRGGTLPPGHYSCTYVQDHPHFHECVQLRRDADTHLNYPTLTGISLDNRGDDFYIHGSGPKGSDGCIVISDGKERKRLNKAVRDFAQQGQTILTVKNVAYLLPAEGGNVAFA